MPHITNYVKSLDKLNIRWQKTSPKHQIGTREVFNEETGKMVTIIYEVEDLPGAPKTTATK